MLGDNIPALCKVNVPFNSDQPKCYFGANMKTANTGSGCGFDRSTLELKFKISRLDAPSASIFNTVGIKDNGSKKGLWRQLFKQAVNQAEVNQQK